MLTIQSVLVKQRKSISTIYKQLSLDIEFSLMVAASAGFSKACVMLLEHDANIFSIDQSGE